MGLHDDQRIGGQLTKLTRSIKDEHSMVDDVTPKTSPSNTRITDEHRVAIQCLQQYLRRLQRHLYRPLKAQ